MQINFHAGATLSRFRLTPYQIIIVLAALICALLVLWRSIQSKIAYHLYDDANTPETNVRAVDRLASIRSEYAKGLLFALVASPSANFSNQTEAILRLGDSRNPKIADELSRFLQPHETLAVQNAVSNSLARMRCETQCISNVLQYLEREYYGEHNEMLDRTMGADLADIQNAVNDNLKTLLAHNPGETLNQLVKVYGLESPQPSKFAVLLTIDLRLTNACPSLLKAQEWMIKYEKLDLHWKAPIEEAIEHLNCKQIIH